MAERKPFRVYVYNTWPATANTTRNVFYFDYFDSAQTRYLKYIIDQVLESRLIMRVTLERFNKHTRKYHVVFESYCSQSVESHGLDPNN